MTEITNEKSENETNGQYTETTGRTRYSLKLFTHLLRDSDDSDGADGIDSESNEDCSESGDEWTENSDRKRKRKSKSITVSPVQTLKKKLAEKTKALRKSASKNTKTAEPVEPSSSQQGEFQVKAEIPVRKSASKNTKTAEPVEPSSSQQGEFQVKAEIPVRKSASKNTKTAEPVEPSSSQQGEFQVKAEIPVGRQFKVEIANEVKVERTDPKVEIENIANADNEVKIKSSEPITYIKIKKTETVFEVEKPKKNEPVVLTYSMVKDSSNISPMLLASGSLNSSTPSFTLNSTPAVASPTSLPVPVTSPSLSASVPLVTRNSASAPTNASLTTPVPRIRIRSNLQASPAFRNSLTVPCRPVAPVIPTGPRPRLRAATPRAPRARTPRTRDTFQRSPVSPALINSAGRPRIPVSTPTPAAHSRPFGGVQSPTISSRTPTNLQKTPNLKDSSSLKNISSNGTVIYSGSNSVTITPRKAVPERPPVQRKLFKNEIEGIIAVRHENGMLKYVINLANGTHMPLTEHQITKLREQNDGRLPTKLKIPVPSDVAAKIEPSYLIED